MADDYQRRIDRLLASAGFGRPRVSSSTYIQLRETLTKVDDLETVLVTLEANRAQSRGEWAYHELKGDEVETATLARVIAGLDRLISELLDELMRLHETLPRNQGEEDFSI